MVRVVVFGEDHGHEVVLKALTERLATEVGAKAEISVRSATKGHGWALSELRRFLKDIAEGRESLPDRVVACIDANCSGLNRKVSEIESNVPERFRPFCVPAVPDPHVERWLLLDSQAFKEVLEVLGTGCTTPVAKCERGLYKRLLRDAVRQAGVTPLLGGLEYAEDIVFAMDIERSARLDRSFRRAVEEIKRALAWHNWDSDQNEGRVGSCGRV
jgi:hypothetical protein